MLTCSLSSIKNLGKGMEKMKKKLYIYPESKRKKFIMLKAKNPMMIKSYKIAKTWKILKYFIYKYWQQSISTFERENIRWIKVVEVFLFVLRWIDKLYIKRTQQSCPGDKKWRFFLPVRPKYSNKSAWYTVTQKMLLKLKCVL